MKETDRLNSEIESIHQKLDAASDILRDLLRTVNNTGGIINFENGTSGLAVDPDYVDMADVVIKAARFLEKFGQPVELITEYEQD